MSTLGAITFDRYAIDEIMAVGPHSAVYRARDQHSNNRVALKSVDATNPQAVAQVVAEARLLQRVNHPGLPRVIEILVSEKDAWLVMTHVPGEDLARQLEQSQHPFSTERVLKWGEQLLDILSYLHQLTPPIVHCDIKPANLKVDEQDQVFLLDFGVARSSAEVREYDGYTLAYCASEQVTGAAITPRTDLYALAATLYDLFTDVKPPDVRLRLTALAEGRSDPLLPASAWNPGLSRMVDVFLLQGMALDPAHRFASAEAMRASLHGCRIGLSSPIQPVNPVEIVGRDAFIGEVRRKLLQSDVPLLTLVGPGGVGKTTIARAAASGMPSGHFREVTFIDFEDSLTISAQQNVQLIREIVARFTTLPPEDAAAYTEPAQGSPHNLLLVIDAGELLASDEDALKTMIANSPQLKVLATSRRPLGARHEHLLAVPPLPIPDRHAGLDAITALQSPAVQMFLAQAKACGVDLQLTSENAKEIVDLCATLDGLPLALKEAAHCLRTLEITEIVGYLFARLSKETASPTSPQKRRDALAPSIAWSIEQLIPQQQRLLVRLTVFCGGFSPHAAHAICCAGVAAIEGASEEDISVCLKQIAAQSLLVTHPNSAMLRYAMLNTTRAYASARLVASGDSAALRLRHAHYFVNLIDTGDTHAAPDAARLTRIEAEYDNLIAALTWSAEHGDATVALRLTTSLGHFWEIRGDYREGLAWFERALALSATEDELRARALSCAGALARNLSQYTAAERYFSASLAIYQQLDDRQGIARMLNGLGTVAYFHDALAATSYFEAALNLHRELNNQHDIAGALNNLALLAEGQGDYPRAAALHHQALELFQALGEDANTAYN
jgi:serine/threonine-protein kinase PknK